MSFKYKDRASDVRTNVHLRLLRSQATSPTGVIVLISSVLYLLCLWYYHSVSYRDPTSYFFDSSRAYERIYSAKRVEEAEAYISENGSVARPVRSTVEPPLICVGIATVARRGGQYVSLTVGSLLAGLREEERQKIFLNLLIGHTDPSRHPIFAEKWVDTLPDRVLEYQKESAEFEQIRAWEEGSWYRNKTIYDYTYLLKDCYDTGAKYVAVLEDDTLAVEGWFLRTLQALDAVENAMKNRAGNTEWIYLRLFYADDLLGWNSEEWPRYLFWSFTVWATVTATMLAIKKRFRRQFERVPASTMIFLICICIPSAIGLHFMAGRQTIWPITPGIHEMNKYGCCSQGFVFPRSIIPALLEEADLETDWLVDMMIETIADKQGYTRWAVVPSLLQHIGVTSSKGYGFDDSAKTLWNFRFEDYPHQ